MKLKIPVIVMIPGGSMNSGSGLSIDLGGPKYIMEQDVVLVTINYRLNVLGFLGLNIKEAPGNAGFKDQVLAFKWVKMNIENFGGDANQVTLLGHSSGAYSVIFHIVSPMSRNLFHGAICMSPAGFLNKLTSNLMKFSQNTAIHAGCMNFSNPYDIYGCLKTNFSLDLLSNDIDLVHLHPVWNAVVEPDFGQERFLIEDPFMSLKYGNFVKVPLIIGTTDAEFVSFSYNIIANETIHNLFSKQFDYLTPTCFRCEGNPDNRKNNSLSILQAYNISIPPLKDQFSNLAKMYADGFVGFAVQRIVDYMHNFVDVFYYHLTFHQRCTRFMIDGKPYGIEHGDEVKYLFNKYPLYNQHDPENVIVERMTRLWTQFARTGNPNRDDDQYIGRTYWKSYTDMNPFYLEFGDKLVLRKNLYADRLKIWYKYFK